MRFGRFGMPPASCKSHPAGVLRRNGDLLQLCRGLAALNQGASTRSHSGNLFQ
jgi:hypothetical protein